MDLLVLFVTTSSSGKNHQCLEQLSQSANLVIIRTIEEAATAVRYYQSKLNVFLTLEESFSDQWPLHQLTAYGASVFFSSLNDHHIRMINEWLRLSKSTPDSSHEHASFHRSLDFIHQNLFDSSLSLDAVSSHIHVSKQYYSKKFQLFAGIGFKDYIINKRIDKAKLMLMRGEAVTHVCFEVGYTDLTHFTRIFKKRVGVSPSQYRRTRSEQRKLMPLYGN